MTMKELLSNVTEGTVVTAEMAEKAQAELAKMAQEASKRNQKAAEKRSAENAPLIEAVKTLLSDHEVRTASQIGKALEISTSKATALTQKIEGVNVSDVVVDKRIVKGYSL